MTQEALALVARFEGLRLHASPLPGGGFVIGHGHVSAADPTREITPDEARALLVFDLSRTAAAIEPLILAPVTAAQFDALLSFALAVGVEAFAESAVLKRLNAGAYLDAASALELWRCARVGGEDHVLDLLVRRRALEKARFLEPAEGFPAAPSALVRAVPDAAALEAFAALAQDGRRVARFSVREDALALAREPGGEPAPSAALAVVAALSARLDRLLAEEPEPPPRVYPPPPVPGGGPGRGAVTPDTTDEDRAQSPMLASAEPPPSPTLPPERGEGAPLPPPPAPANDHGGTATRPVPLPAAPPTPPPAPPAIPTARRPLTWPRRHRAERPREPRVSWPSLRGPGLVLGAFGLILFLLAVQNTYKAPSLKWLLVGLAAVLAMVPATLIIIGPRRRDDD